jgi:hypothetical protein
LYTEYTYGEALLDALTEVEEQLPRPLSVFRWTAALNEAHELQDQAMLLTHGPRRDYDCSTATIGDEVYHEVIVPSALPASPIYVDGALIGEIRPYRVYCYLALQYTNPTTSITEALCEALKLACDPEFIESEESREAVARREALTQFVRASYDRRVNDRRANLDGRQRMLIEYQDYIVNTMREIREDQELLDALLLVRSNDAGDTILREWDQLEAHPRVARCSFDQGSLCITTTDDLRLHRPDTNESRWLGAFEIKVDIATFAVYMTNLNTRRGGRDHPHVVDNRPCFGGHQETFTELLGRGELYTVFELLLQYIETLNLADEYGRYGSYWFDVEDERPLEVVKEAVAA